MFQVLVSAVSLMTVAVMRVTMMQVRQMAVMTTATTLMTVMAHGKLMAKGQDDVIVGCPPQAQIPEL